MSLLFYMTTLFSTNSIQSYIEMYANIVKRFGLLGLTAVVILQKMCIKLGPGSPEHLIVHEAPEEQSTRAKSGNVSDYLVGLYIPIHEIENISSN